MCPLFDSNHKIIMELYVELMFIHIFFKSKLKLM